MLFRSCCEPVNLTMEETKPQSHCRQPTTKHYLLLSLSIFILGSATLVYLKYQFITSHLRSLFPTSAVPTLNLPPGGNLTIPTSKVQGKKFDRFVTIWLENQDYSIAAGDRTFSCAPPPPPPPLLLSPQHFPPKSMSSLTLSSKHAMGGHARHHTHQLLCAHPPQPT